MKCFATAAAGTVPILVDELKQLGASRIDPRPKGVSFEGDQETIYRICLWSRIANRILLPITTLQVSTPEELYKEIKAIRWEKHLHSSGTLAIDVTAVNAAISHSRYAMLTVKDGVVDRFRELFDERPSIDIETPDLRLNLLMQGKRAQISIDLSGGSLHRRGYRVDGAAAPLKENLAASLLMLSNWPEISESGGTLIDPMCGSGTLLIEAGLIAAKIAPGLLRRDFGFLRWRRHTPDIWEKLVSEAEAIRDQSLAQCPPIYGCDIDADAISAATANIEAAGLSGQITLEQTPFEECEPKLENPHGLIIVNPPYGARLGEVEQLRSTYKALGNWVRLHQGWAFSLFTGNPELAKETSQIDPRPTELKNGPIACQLFRSKIASPNLAAVERSEGATMLYNRIQKNLKHLRKWAKREKINCYRVYDADLPEYAVAIDLYQGKENWVHLQEYAPPSTIEPETARQRLQEAIEVVPEIFEISPTHLFVKVRERQRGDHQYRKQADDNNFFSVKEGDVSLLVNLSDYLDTGLFLDHRNTRLWIGDNANDKDVLNLFAYTGSATIHAAKGGARSTTTVDLSKTYLDWAQRNMNLNGLSSPYQHRFIHADVMQWLDQEAANSEARQYDLIFLDPPTFSNSKRSEDIFDIQRDHTTLIDNAMRLLRPDGVLIFSNNFRKFKLDNRVGEMFHLVDITNKSIPFDFRRNQKIHRCWEIRHK